MTPTERAGTEAAHDLTIGLLGPIEVRRDGVALDLGGPQPRALVAHLALEVGRVVPVERLVDRIWGESPPRATLTALQSYVSRLRRMLEPDRPPGAPAAVLVSEAPGYVLRLPREGVDVMRFRALVDAARTAAGAGDHADAVARFDDALALWRGPALAGIGPEEVVRGIVVRLEDDHVSAVEDRFESLLVLGRHAELIGELQAAVTDEPLRERLQAQLALALYRSRRQAEALRSIAGAREALLDVGIDPGPELRELETQILAQDPALDVAPLTVSTTSSTSSAAPPTPTRTPTSPRLSPPSQTPVATVVGRREEWDGLRAALGLGPSGTSATGGRQLALVEGDPGIGKTTMLDALAAEAVAAGWRVAATTCAEPGLAPVLWPWIEVVRAVSADSMVDAGRVDDRNDESATPPLVALLSEASPAAATPLSAVETAEHVAELLRASAEEAPRLVVLDDLHWADQATLDLLALVYERLGDARVVIAAGHRPPELVADAPFPQVLGTLARLPGLRRVRLTGLDRDDVAALMTLVSGESPSAETADAVCRRTDGNPLFVAELARLAAASGSDLAAGDVVPDAVRDVVRRRLSQLPPVTNDVLVAAAVLGQEVELRVLAVVTGDTLEEAFDALDPAVATRILVPGEGGDFRFAHALVRDAVLAELSALRRARLHQRVADAIEKIHGVDADHAEPIAWHRLAARSVDDPARVTAALTAAADVAWTRSALDRSEELVDLALDVARSVPPGEARVALELSALETRLSIETMRSFMSGDLDSLATRIDAVAERNDSDAVRQLATFTRWSKVNVDGPATVEADARHALALAERATDTYTVVVGRHVAATHAFLAGRIDEACQHYRVGLAAADEVGEGELRIATFRRSSLGLAPIAAQLAGDDDTAERLVATFTNSAGQRRDGGVKVDVAFTSGVVHAVRGDAERTRADTAAVAQPAPPWWMPHTSAICCVLHAWASVELGAGRDALELGVKALGELDEGAVKIAVPAMRTFLAAARLRLDEAAALDDLRRARHDAESTGDRWWLAETLRLLAHAESRFGDASLTPGLRTEARELALEQGVRVVVDRLDREIVS